MARRLRLLALLLVAAPAAAATGGTTSQLSHGSTTDQQNSPAISGTHVVWTDALTSPTGGSNFDIWAYDISTGAAPIDLTNTPDDQEFLEDIDGTNVVYTHTSAGITGDIVIYDLTTNVATTVASSTSDIHYQEPGITGRWLTFLQVGTAQTDVDLLDTATGTPYFVTNDAATQARPRVGTDYVVYEDYNSGNADIFGWQISTQGPAFAIASGPDSQVTPDIYGNTVVYVETVNGSDQLFSYDLGTQATRQLTSASSNKVLPRISGSRIVWSDDRNGNLDLYLYDLSTSTESPLVTGTGDQFLSDIDGDRVVYTDNAAGFEQVFLYTFDPVTTPPPALPEGCDPAKTNAVGASVPMQHNGWRPTYAGGSFTRQPGKTYWVCVDNGLPDGSERATQFSFEADHRVILTPSDFRPVANPPQHVAAKISDDGHGKCNTHGLGNGHDDDDNSGPMSWTAALFGRQPPIHATVTIRVSR